MLGIPHEYLTAHLPGIGGVIKQEHADFYVEEVPLYAASGSGEHTYFEIEKIGRTTRAAVERIAQELGLPPDSIGYAGLKDRKGVTRQTLSVACGDSSRLRQLSVPGVEVLRVSRHTNKLRLGHLLGNRFRVRVREVCSDAEARLNALLPLLKGIPNFYGPQRFGSRGIAHMIGRALLRKDYRTAVDRLLGRPSSTEAHPDVIRARRLFMAGQWEEAHRAFPPEYRDELRVLYYLLQAGERYSRAVTRLRDHSRRMYVCAFQSYLFNLTLSERMRQAGGDLECLFEGDLAYLHGSGAVFDVKDPERERVRVERFEISPSGPLFGSKMIAPKGKAAEIERAVLRREGLDLEGVRRLFPRRFFDGVRRPLRVPVQDLSWQLEGKDLLIQFFLPKGAYATTFLREITKNEVFPEEYYEDGERERHLLWQPSRGSVTGPPM